MEKKRVLSDSASKFMNFKINKIQVRNPFANYATFSSVMSHATLTTEGHRKVKFAGCVHFRNGKLMSGIHFRKLDNVTSLP